MPNRTITLPDPPSNWNILSKEQLIYIHSLPRSEMPEQVFKLKVFLYLCGLELCEESYYAAPEEPEKKKQDNQQDEEDIDEEKNREEEIKELDGQIKWMESVMDGTAEITVVLRKISNESEKVGKSRKKSESDKEDADIEDSEDLRMIISDHDLFNAVEHFTTFLDDPYTLMIQPLGDIRIGEHTYHTPDSIFANLTYEQYQNAQESLGNLWSTSENIENLHKQLTDAAETHAKRQQTLVERSRGKYTPSEFKPDPNLIKEIEEETLNIKECQTDFLCHVLTMLQPKLFEEPVLDKHGLPSYTKRGIAKLKQILRMESPTKEVDSYAWRMRDEIKELAPPYLFPILYQHFQSSLSEHKKKFPKLFAGKKVAGETNPDEFVSKLSTINSLMKEQGYMSQQDVLDANAVFNFQKLDELTRRAEEMDKMNKEMKRKSKRR